MTRKIILQFIGALSLTIVGALLSFLIGFLTMFLELGINLGGDKTPVFFVLFLGIPLGSLFGILLVDRIFFKYEGYNLIGLCIGFALSVFIGGVGGVMLLDKIGGLAVFFIPLLIIFISFIGYYIPLLLAR